MEGLLAKLLANAKLENLLKELKSEGEEEANEEDKKSPTADDLHLIYTTSKICIYQTADILSSSPFSEDDGKLQSIPPKIEVPLQYEWDLKLGDRVRIKYPLEEFKYIQQKTTGWTRGLSNYLGHIGFVSHLYSRYDNRVMVAFTEFNNISVVYAGVLEKVETQDEAFPSKWKPGDYVRTRGDRKVFKFLQRALGNIPSKYIGKRGRIVAVTPVGAFVTFDERETCVIKTALLLPCEDKSSLEIPMDKHPKGIEVGDKVRVISNLKQLIKNQKISGGWNPAMHTLCGKEAKITDINKDGTVDVAIGGSVGWRVNADSLNEPDQHQTEKDLDFLLGDKVKVKVTENIRNLLAAKEIPAVFLEYLRSTAIVDTVDDDLDAVIQFDKKRRSTVNMRSIRKATKDEVEMYDFIRESEKFGVGDSVYLDVGPPNYVRHILQESDTDPAIVKAMTNASKFLGYLDAKYGVIQYNDGSMYKIKTKYLTVPKKFGVVEKGFTAGDKKFSFKVVNELQELLLHAVMKIHLEKKEEMASVLEVDVHNVQLRGEPPSVTFRVRSDLASSKLLMQTLQDENDLGVEYICEGVFLVTKMKSYERKIKVNLLFNDEEYVSREIEPGVITESIEGAGAIDDKARPIDGREPDAEPPGSPPPEIDSFEQFRYLRFYDRSLAQTVYFPYVVLGPRRAVEKPGDYQRNRRQIINNQFNFNKVAGSISIGDSNQTTHTYQNIME